MPCSTIRPQVLESVPASIYAVNAPMLAPTATRNLIDLAGQVLLSAWFRR